MDAFWAALSRHPVNCGRGLPVLIDQVEPQPLEAGGADVGEPGDGHPDRLWPGGVRWPVAGRGRQEVGEAVVIVMRGCRGSPGLLLATGAATSIPRSIPRCTRRSKTVLAVAWMGAGRRWLVA